MKFNDVLNYAFKNIGFKGLRSWLTIIGIVIGIASVVGLMTYSESVNTAINNQLSGFGSQIITVTPGAATRGVEMRFMQGGGGGFSRTVSSSSSESPVLTDSDISVLERIPGIVAVSPVVSNRFTIEYNGEVASGNVLFINPSDYEQVRSVDISDGNFIDDNSNQIVLGYSIANSFFTTSVKVGDDLKIGDLTFKVAGILGQGGFNSNDNSILMSFSEISSLVSDFEGNYPTIELKAESIDAISGLTTAITATLRDSRDVAEGSEDFQVMSQTTIMNNVSSVIGTLSLFLIGIAAISLLVGAISIANTMFTSVFEKTRDIGIMKALGADDSDVLRLFVTESAMISLLGGFGGVIVGLFVAQVLLSLSPVASMMPGVSSRAVSSLSGITVSPEMIALSLLFSIIIGVISGYLPARKAANMNPIEAIWYE